MRAPQHLSRIHPRSGDGTDWLPAGHTEPAVRQPSPSCTATTWRWGRSVDSGRPASPPPPPVWRHWHGVTCVEAARHQRFRGPWYPSRMCVSSGTPHAGAPRVCSRLLGPATVCSLFVITYLIARVASWGVSPRGQGPAPRLSSLLGLQGPVLADWRVCRTCIGSPAAQVPWREVLGVPLPLHGGTKRSCHPLSTQPLGYWGPWRHGWGPPGGTWAPFPGFPERKGSQQTGAVRPGGREVRASVGLRKAGTWDRLWQHCVPAPGHTSPRATKYKETVRD